METVISRATTFTQIKGSANVNRTHRKQPKTTVYASSTDPLASTNIDRRNTLASVAAAVALLNASSIAAPPPALARKIEDCTDIKTASNGLQYCDIKVGSGDPPVPKAFIKVHYEGRLESETASGIFDSSYERGKPFAFSVGSGQVIRGWDLGILGDKDLNIPSMLPGGKRRLIIPPELAYGDRGVGPIPPKSTLTFDVEYLNRLGVK